MMIELEAIGHVRDARAEAVDDFWGDARSRIVLNESVGLDALDGIEQFSHAEILYLFDRVPEEKIQRGARHPRNNPDWPKIGILAQRGKNRPNQIGVTVCRVLRVDGPRLYLQGLDAVDGSPVLDIKPWVREFGPRGDVVQPAWITELMQGYWSA